MKTNTLFSIIAAVLAILCFFFAFATASTASMNNALGNLLGEYSYSFSDADLESFGLYDTINQSKSGFGCAFAFGNFGCVAVFLALLLGVAGIVLSLIKLDKIGALCFGLAALFCLISVFTIGAGTFDAITAGVGNWLSTVFFLAAAVLAFIKLPALGGTGGRSSYGGSSYRPAAGGAASAGSFCTNCGTKCPADVKFCPSCGAKR